jgi:hypothetical protein
VQNKKYGKHTIANAIRHGSKQADYVIVNLPKKISKSKMYRVANGRFINHRKLKVIIFKYKNEYYEWNRSAFKMI